MDIRLLNNGLLANTGSCEIGRIVIYGDGAILLDNDCGFLEEYEMRNNKKGNATIQSVYDGRPETIFLENDFKRANKENLTRNDNYYIVYNDYCGNYLLGRKTALYIHKSEISVNPLGAVLATETDDEKNYLNAFELSFKKVTFRRCCHEKIICDNYTLNPGERFSTYCGDYGRDKEHAIIRYFDTSKSILRAKRELNEKGIIKQWIDTQTIDNYTMLTTSRGYCKSEYSERRLNRDKIADVMNSVLSNKNISHYDVERLESVLNITLK